MTTARVVVTLITAVITAAVGVADLIPAGFVLANSAKVHVPRSLLPLLGAAKLTGAFQLLVGLVGPPAIGITAATGLVLFFIGALIARWNRFSTTSLPGRLFGLVGGDVAGADDRRRPPDRMRGDHWGK